MSDLKTEIREAFEAEQAASPPPSALRAQLVAAVTSRTDIEVRQAQGEPNRQWLAVAAAILITASIVVGLVAIRFVQHPSPAGDFGPPPAGVQLIYVHDPNDPSRLIAYDWAGQQVGSVKPQHPALKVGASVRQAPDGQRFQVVGGDPVSGLFLDRLGQPLPNSPQLAGSTRGVWADDSRHVCVMALNPSSQRWVLVTEAPAYSEEFLTLPSVGRSSILVVGCSWKNDRAILVRNDPPFSEIWVAKLSNGAILSHHTFAAASVANLRASQDAAYIALMPGLEGDGVTRILRVSDWTQVATAGASTVLGFSGDDSLALLGDFPKSGAPPPTLRLVNWASGTTIWHGQGTNAFSILVRPGGRDFAIAFFDPAQPELKETIVIIHGDGSETRFPDRYTPTW
jgi:hypothetical protein